VFYSLWYNEHTMLPTCSLEVEELRFQATGWQHRGCINPYPTAFPYGKTVHRFINEGLKAYV